MWSTKSILFTALVLPLTRVLAIGGPQCLSFTATKYTIATSKSPATIIIDQSDWPGVHRAAIDLQNDLEKVTGLRPIVVNITVTSTNSVDISPGGDQDFRDNVPIIIGTLGKSSLINAARQQNSTFGSKAAAIEGKWEAGISEVIANPFSGISAAYVIAGSDKRGTIYGIYDISEQAGVSPW